MGLLYAAIFAVSTGWTVHAIALVGSIWILSVLAIALVVRPYVHRFGTGTGSIPAGHRRRVEAICAGHGVRVRRSWTTTEHPGGRAAEIAGFLPWDRHFVVDGWLFASLSPAERAALAAREAVLARRRYQSFRHLAGPTVVAGVAGLLVALAWLAPPGAFASANAPLLAVGSAVAYVLVAHWGANRLYAADRHAARVTSRETVVGLLEKSATRYGGSVWHRWPLSVLMMRPTTERRIERLRACDL